MSLKRKALFITNPISGAGGKINITELIQSNLDSSKFDWSIYETTGRGDATLRAQQAVKESYDLVVAVGGDGTINEVAQGLINTNVCMSILPKGSGNGLANHLNISTQLPQAISQLNHARETWIDTGWFNEQLFLNVAGIGFDAQVAYAFDHHNQRGLFSYIFLSLREFFNFSAPNFTIEADDQRIETKAFIVTIANGSQYGNNAFIAPNANISDGLLDLVIIHPFKPWQLFTFPAKLFARKLKSSSNYQFIKAKKICITSTSSNAQLDGEPYLTSMVSKIEIKPNSLKMLVP
ncbi:diacylglycerol kinase family lipid kinase [Reichenbachiella agarivorans]|uniref:Diacylglycerol kinase family lipid kinase n=1 Tax=Reichenbachiella agarivorans TaxID=2979464 RepID=A0ABY6CQX1_9BACT|nr:diacylglycerol kinase family protein [Reichenbachiella agarivorans]UXP32911.1 diacylglycerol kinase family lipid kinase [Reichenbachiella agarivorans]